MSSVRTRWLSAGVLLCSFTAFAAPPQKIAVVTTGDCRDPELTGASRDLAKELGHRNNIQLVDESQVLEKLGRGPTRSIDEIQRQIDTAQQQFYSAQYFKAISQLESTMAEIQRLPPGPAHWQLWVTASILEGLTRSRLKKGSGSEDAFRRVLRIDPNHQLDPDYFAPSTLALFERIRKETAALKKGKLHVQSTPAGATVFIDGRAIGKTPFTAELARGPYQVVVGREDVFSLPREVTIDDEAELRVDLRFESAIDTDRSPCIATTRDEKSRLDDAVKLGTVLEVDQLVLLRFDRPKVGRSWLSATLVDVGHGSKIREGGLQVETDGLTQQGISELAQFVATGEPTGKVRPEPETSKTETPVVNALPPDASGPIAAPPADGPLPSTTSVTASGRDDSWRKPLGLTLTTVGGAALVAGIALQVDALSANSEYQSWVDGGSKPQGALEAREARDRAGTSQTLAYVGYGVGAAAVGTGLFLWLGADDDGQASSTHAAIIPSSNGGAFVLSGEF